MILKKIDDLRYDEPELPFKIEKKSYFKNQEQNGYKNQIKKNNSPFKFVMESPSRDAGGLVCGGNDVFV